jgi:hypothetical protein
MSYRSSLSVPDTSSGNVGAVKISPAFTPIANVQNTQQLLTSVILPAGSYVISSNIELLTAGATGNLYIGIDVNGVDTTNWYMDVLSTGAENFQRGFCNVVTLTASTNTISLFTTTDTAAAGLTYNIAVLQALKIA